jgi:hypothetical protein
MQMLKNIAAIKPTKKSEVNALGIQALECLCEHLVPTSVLEVEDNASPLQPGEGNGDDPSHADSGVLLEMPKHKRKRKVYYLCTARRRTRNKFKRKFDDEK